MARGVVFAIGMSLALSGCGGDHVPPPRAVHPVEGQVIWNGKPLVGARVTFYPKSWKTDKGNNYPTALTGPDGRYKLTTHAANDGAPEGEYTVLVVYNELVPVGEGKMPGANVLPKKYERPETSGLDVQVAKGPNVVPPFDLKASPEDAKKKKT